jgi:hypothetical protein
MVPPRLRSTLETWELAEQEDFESVLIATLAEGWTEQYGQEFRVTAAVARGPVQQWFLEPTMTTLYTKDVTRAVRRFMMDRFRFTPVTARAPFQWLVGTALGSRARLYINKRVVFGVDPPIPRAANVLIVPGSRRVRIFDFSAGLSRSLLKRGYPVEAVSNEVTVREGRGGPFPPLFRRAADQTWFEEPIIDGYPLPRCPPWWPRQRYATEILDTLREWSSVEAEKVPAPSYAEELARRISAGQAELLDRFRDVPLPDPAFLELLMEAAGSTGELELVQSHGDLQPGNIHVQRTPRRVFLIDWEYATRRSRAYDFLTYGLRARYPSGLGARMLEFISEPATRLTLQHLSLASREERASSLALFLLEDLERSISDSIHSPYKELPYGFRLVCRELTLAEGELKKAFLKGRSVT